MARPKMPLQFLLIETSWNLKNEITKEKEDIKQHFDDLEAIWEKYSVYDK